MLDSALVLYYVSSLILNMAWRSAYLKLSLLTACAVVLLLAPPACEKCDPPCDCPDCPPVDSLLLTEMGEKMKAELQQLFLDIENLALLRFYNCSGDTCYWSGFDAGDPMTDSRQIQLDFFETELLAVFKMFTGGKWTLSSVAVPFNQVLSFVIQNVTFVNGSGQVIRRANNVLIYLKDGTCPVINGSDTSHI